MAAKAEPLDGAPHDREGDGDRRLLESAAQMSAGEEVRRAVLGDEYVDGQQAQATRAEREFEAFVTSHCWDAVWTRPGVGRATRSLVNVGMLIALKRDRELRLHLRGAIRNGCSVAELYEVVLQAAVYCGIPAGVQAFRALREEMGEVSSELWGKGK